MKKKMISMCMCALLISMLFPLTNTVMAGDEEHPEITDRGNDVLFLGGLYQNPFLSLFFKHIDIISAWFFEDNNSPETLYASLKLSNFHYAAMRAWYALFWQNTEEDWAAVLIIDKGETMYAGVQRMNSDFIEINDFFSIDETNDIITFAIPKESVGNLGAGDTLGYPYAAAAVQFSSNELNDLLQNLPLAIDITNEGLEYTIRF